MLHRLSTKFAVFIVAGLFALTGCAEESLLSGNEEPLESTEATHQSTQDGPETTGKHLVLFEEETIPDAFEQRVAELGGTVETELDVIGVAVVDGLSGDAVEALREDDLVQQVEPDIVLQPESSFEMAEGTVFEADAEAASDTEAITDPTETYFWPYQWHLRVIDAVEAWEAGHHGSEDVTVAIIDTGLDYNHANLQGLVDLDRSISLLPGQDEWVEHYFPGAHPIADLNRHGTHVAATIVSNPEIHGGVTQKGELFGVKVCRGRGGGTGGGCPRSAVLKAIVYAADNGADIMNVSIGGSSLLRDYNGLHRYILRATNYAHQQGALVVVAAGNSAKNLDKNRDEFQVYCEASNVVCVSATGPTDRDSRSGPFYNFGEPAFFTNYGRSVIDVAAPGGNSNNFVYAACSSFSLRSTVCQNSGRYIIGLRGTSMAAPHAAGVAALIMSEIGTGNPSQVRNRLHQTAEQLGDSGNDPYYGKGRVNAAAALGLE